MTIVDSNIWIFAELKDAPEHNIASAKLQQLLECGEIGINAIIVSEVFNTLSRFCGAEEARERTSQILGHQSTEWLELGTETVKSAMKLACDCRIRINDAIIARQALELGMHVFTDNLKDFEKVDGLAIIPLRSGGNSRDLRRFAGILKGNSKELDEFKRKIARDRSRATARETD